MRKHNDKRNEDLGACLFYCEHCRFEFEVEWIDIFAQQEATHGFVGFHLHEEYIACPKCGENTNKEKVGENSIKLMDGDRNIL